MRFFLKHISLFGALILLATLQAGLIFIIFSSSDKGFVSYIWNKLPESKEKEFNPAGMPHRAYIYNQDFYEEAYLNTVEVKQVEKEIYGGIIPHHLFVKNELAAYFLGLENRGYETVVLLAPNHFSTGDNAVVFSSAGWNTPYGYLEPDLLLAKKLFFSGIAMDEEAFYSERSVKDTVSFIKKSLPNAKFLPILFDLNANKTEVENLVNVLHKEIDPDNTLVLTSLDFSHYQTAIVADFHDRKSQAVLESFDYSRVYDLEVDCPACLYAGLKYFEKIGARESDLLYHTNTSLITDKPDEPGTSHSFYYFYEGDKKERKYLNFLFFGDLMIDRHIGDKIAEKGFDYLFENLAGEEKRFFWGTDIIGANLEGAVTDKGAHYDPTYDYDFAFAPEIVKNLKKYNFNYFTNANNHLSDQGDNGIIETKKNMEALGFLHSGCQDRKSGDCSLATAQIGDQKIGLAGFSMVYGLLDEENVLDIITKAKAEVDILIVNIHWGTEYANIHGKIQEDLAHKMIDAGADVIIGHHPHVVQDMEVYNDKPIFYSLGNFIFDQTFSQDTQIGLAVGISVNNGEWTINLFPIKSENYQVRLMNQAEKDEFLENLINRSTVDDELKESIRQGVIRY